MSREPGAPTPPVPDPPQRLAAGFRLRTDGEVLVVEGPFTPPGWHPRAAGDAVRLPFPGTPVLVGEAYYEVVEETPLGPGEAVRFVLRPWDHREVMRSPSGLSVAACRSWAAERRDGAKRDQRARRLARWMPLVGLLPAADQRAIERELGLSAPRLTLVSAATFGALTLPPAFIGLVSSLAGAFGASFPGFAWTVDWLPVLGYVALESWVRAHLATSSDDAIGSLPVVLTVAVARLLRGGARPG